MEIRNFNGVIDRSVEMYDKQLREIYTNILCEAIKQIYSSGVSLREYNEDKSGFKDAPEFMFMIERLRYKIEETFTGTWIFGNAMRNFIEHFEELIAITEVDGNKVVIFRPKSS